MTMLKRQRACVHLNVELKFPHIANNKSIVANNNIIHWLGHCYSFFTLITMRGNELVIFSRIALYSDDKYIF